VRLPDEADFITGQVISPNGGEVIVGAGPRYRVSPTGASRILVLTHIRGGVSVGPSLMPL
jgi:hypothetical protein